jgi:hypothetical protein
MPTWREDVLEAVRDIGGIGTLAAIYDAVERRRADPLPTSWQAIVRRELEYNSSDSASHQKRHDLFRSAHGIGGGVWALRDVALDKDEPVERREVTVNRITRRSTKTFVRSAKRRCPPATEPPTARGIMSDLSGAYIRAPTQKTTSSSFVQIATPLQTWGSSPSMRKHCIGREHIRSQRRT